MVDAPLSMNSARTSSMEPRPILSLGSTCAPDPPQREPSSPGLGMAAKSTSWMQNNSGVKWKSQPAGLRAPKVGFRANTSKSALLAKPLLHPSSAPKRQERIKPHAMAAGCPRAALENRMPSSVDTPTVQRPFATTRSPAALSPLAQMHRSSSPPPRSKEQKPTTP